MQLKSCKICKKDLPLKNFHRKAGCKDGRLPRCKSCRVATEKSSRPLWTARSSFRKGVQTRIQAGLQEQEAEARFLERRKKRQESKHLSPAERKKRNDERRKLWYQANKERLKVSRAEYFRKYRKDNSEYYSLACHKRRARLRDLGMFTLEQWEQLQAQYDYRCLCCGKRTTDKDFPRTVAGNPRLTKDHVVPICVGGANDISNIQPLCWKCHRLKGRSTTDYRRSPSQKA